MSERNDSSTNADDQQKLITRIKTAPDCTVYGISRYNQNSIVWARRLTAVLTALSTIIIIALNQTVMAAVTIFLILVGGIVIYAFLTYLNWSHNYFEIFVSSIGVANETKWATGAMTWDQVEIIEVKYKRGKIDYIILRQGFERLGTRSSFLAHRLSLDVVSEFVGGLDNWHFFDNIEGETKADEFYVRPDRDRSKAKKQLEDLLLMEWVGEQDFDAGQTKEQISSKSDEEVYRLILNDPRCVCLKDSGRFSRFLGNCKLTLTMLIIAMILSFYGAFGGPFSAEAFIVTIILFILMFYSMCKGDEQLIISPIGVARFIHGGPEAIEWHHVEYIDLVFEEDQLVQVEFFGNRRRIYCPRHTYRGKFSLSLIRQYLPNIDNWEKMTRSHWGKGTYRLIRPEA